MCQQQKTEIDPKPETPKHPKNQINPKTNPKTPAM
jgi:hypothetical protein